MNDTLSQISFYDKSDATVAPSRRAPLMVAIRGSSSGLDVLRGVASRHPPGGQRTVR